MRAGCSNECALLLHCTSVLSLHCTSWCQACSYENVHSTVHFTALARTATLQHAAAYFSIRARRAVSAAPISLPHSLRSSTCNTVRAWMLS